MFNVRVNVQKILDDVNSFSKRAALHSLMETSLVYTDDLLSLIAPDKH